MKRIAGIEVLIWCSVLLIVPPHADGDQIFLLEQAYGGRAVWQVNLDGSDLKRISHPILSGFYGFAAIGFNPADQKLYASEHHGGIWRSSPDGDDIELLIGSGGTDPQPVHLVDSSDAHVLAFDQQFIYWGAGAEPNQISRLNLAGDADIEPILQSGPWVTGLAVDSISSTVYWATDDICGPGCTGKLNRANLDGSDWSIIAHLTDPGKVALDGKGYLYWVDGGLYRGLLDGSDAVEIIPDVSTFALDSRTNSLIFARETTMMRATTLGENVQSLVTLPFQVLDMALRTNVPEPSADYDANGLVDQGDLDLVLLHWGSELADPAAAGWVSDLPSGTIDQQELDTVLLNWGSGGLSSSVPEPASAGPLLACIIGITLVRRWSTRADRQKPTGAMHP